jgi:hypothetical protein
MTGRLAAVAAVMVALISCGTDVTVSGDPCESPSTREALQTCRPPTAAEVVGAELLIGSLETPISPAKAEEVITATQPGLTAEVGYFFVPIDGPQEPAGTMSLTSGVDAFVSQVAAVLASNGQAGADRVMIYAIGFLPAGSEWSISDALEVLTSEGFQLHLCTIPVVRGGCSFPAP